MAAGVIKLRLRSKRIGGTPVLGAMAFAVERGERVALTGASGVGKTTLLRILAGLDREFEGDVVRPATIAMVFQEPTLLPWRSARRNICLAAGVSIAVADRLLGEVGLDGRGDALPGQLSLGQQRRLALARALAAEPELLLMDEPFASLDAALIDEMLLLTRRLLDARDTASIFVTHSEREAERLADRIIRLGGQPAQVWEQVPGLARHLRLSG
jgi:NitT/TauT family transport system ATP-binding protein